MSNAPTDIRWQQRFNSFTQALATLKSACLVAKERALSELEKQGLIKSFEFTHELAWNVMKDYFEYQGASSITGSRDATRESFRRGLIKDGDTWMEMIASRNKTSHTYNQKIAKEISEKILAKYQSAFLAFEQSMKDLLKK